MTPPKAGADARDDLIARAVTHHRAGRLEEAATLYRRRLDAAPDDPDALHLLGLVDHQLGRHAAAAALIEQALAADPRQPTVWTNLSTVLRAVGRPLPAHRAASAALALLPDHAPAHFSRGVLWGDGGAADDAVASFTRVLAIDPDHATARANLGAVLLDLGKAVEAERMLRAALAADPDLIEAAANLGNALRDQGRHEEAVATYHQVLRRRPNFAPALANLGVAQLRAGERELAVAALREAVRAQPDLVVAHVSLGHVLREMGRHAAAEAACRRALALNPAQAEAHYNLGIVLKDTGRNAEALAAFAAAIACRPGFAAAHSNLGVVLREDLRMEDALAAFMRAGDLDRQFAAAESNALLTMLFMDRFAQPEILAAHQRFGRRHGSPAAATTEHRNPPDPERRLRIGYLSPQLRAHVLAPAMLPVFEHHRRAEVSVHVFAHVPDPDPTTQRMRDVADEWVFVERMSDAEIAQRIRQTGIDILINPMGHWADSRIAVLALKPAPIQVSYQCNAPTTGLAAVDYAIIDRWVDFDGSLAGLMTEIPVHLPGGFGVMAYEHAPVIAPPPCLVRGHVTFGSFNNPAKLSDLTLGLWSRVLAAVPSARLLVKGRGLERREPAELLRMRMAAVGIAPERVELRGVIKEVTDHLASYDDVDIALDALPFTGSGTTVDALWMGVPVITLAGDALYGRYSYGYLHRIGAPELIAARPEDLVRIAAELAHAPDRLAAYRVRLRDMVRNSSLMDFAGHVAELEDALRAMWRRWCATRAG